MQTHTTDLMIIGGGASGLAAAVAAKQLYPEISVTILERNARVGKKILATGNGRCNLGNTNQDLEHYHGSFAEQCKKIFSDTQSAEIFFQNMGLLSRHETDGRLYPLSNQATSVLDAIRFTAQQLGVSIACDCDVTALQKSENVLEVKTTQGVYPASAVILAVGGFAAPKTGSDGSAFSWLEQLGHTTVPTKPALVPFYTEPKLVHPLKGIRIPAEVSAVSESGTVLAKDTGEVQFTERTISGICVMNLSARCCKEEPTMLSLRLLPNIASQKIESILWELYGIRANWKQEDWLSGLFPKKVGTQLLRTAGVTASLESPVYQIAQSQLEQVAENILSWKFPVLSRGGWSESQVTAGGISANETDDTLQSKMMEGLFFAGEILDLHGDCGGYNLNWAWQSGQFAGKNAAEYVIQKRGENH